MPLPYIETVREGQKPRWPFIKTGPNKYETPQKEGFVFVGWKYSDSEEIIRPPFDDETNNPFRVVGEDVSIYAVWEEQQIEDVYILSNLGSETIVVTEQEQLIDTIEILSTKNGLPYDELTFELESGVDWIELQEIENVGDGNFLIKVVVSELPEELYEVGRNATVTITQIDGETISFEIRQCIEEIIDDYCDPIVENKTGATSLALKLYCVDTNGRIYISKYINNTDVSFTCACTLFAIFEKNNTGGINVDINSVNFSYSIIENEGIMFIRSNGYGLWPGGYAGIPVRDDIRIKTKINGNVYKDFSISYGIDEDNNLLVRGEIVNKAIRIPTNGINGKIQIMQYPYNFESPLFFEDPKMTYFYLNNGTLQTHQINGDSFSDGSFECQLIQDNESVLDYEFAYNIGVNEDCNFKHYIVFVGREHLNLSGGVSTPNCAVLLHFIQEYNVKNRIYYGKGFDKFSKPTFDDNYNEMGTGQYFYFYHSWFETCSSTVLMENEETFENYQMVAYPNEDFDYDVETTGTTSTLNTNYLWGGKSYTIINMVSVSNIKFRRK